MQGWIPAPLTNRAEKLLKKVSPTVALEFYDPVEGEEPPVILQNATMVKPFESVVTGFSLPSPYGIDPTAVMMPFFINFMGMMISDAGYGLMMAVLMPLLIKILKPAPSGRKMLWLLAAGGIATTFWGAMYNSWFGYSPFPSPLDPMICCFPMVVIIFFMLPSIIPELLIGFLCSLLFSTASTVVELMVDVAHPRFGWKNETEAIKQNGMASLGMFGSMGFIAACGGAFYGLSVLGVSHILSLVLLCAVALVLNILFFHRLMGKASQTYILQEVQN